MSRAPPRPAPLAANPGTAPLVSLASGALAGAAATVASYPFDLLRTTLAAQGEPKVRRGPRTCGVHALHVIVSSL